MVGEVGVVCFQPHLEAVGDAAYFLLIFQIVLALGVDAELADVDLDGDVVDESEVFAQDGVVVDDSFFCPSSR